MSSLARRSWLRGAIVGAAVLAVLMLGRLVWAQTFTTPVLFLLHFAAVLVAAWVAGFGAGLGVTGLSLLSLLSGYYVELDTGSSDRVPSTAAALAVEGLALSWLTTRLARERRCAHQAVEEARGASDQLQVVLEGIRDGITLQDHTGNLVYANEAAAAIVGFSSVREFLEAPMAEVFQRFEMFDVNGAPLSPDRLPNRALFAGRQPEETLLQYRMRGTGETRWSVVRAQGVRDEAGRLRFVVSVFRDVTERQRQEAELRVTREWFSTALRSIGDAVIATDASGGITFLNAKAEELTGWPSRDAVGWPLAEVYRVVRENTREPLESPVERALAGGGAAGSSENTLLVRRGGGEVAVDDTVAPILANSGKLEGVVLVFRDVTTERRAEERRDFLTRATVELNSSLDYAATLATVARLAIPRIADWCAVDIVEDGKLQQLAVAHVDPSKVGWVQELLSRYPPDPDARQGTPQILRSGQPELITHIPPMLLEAVARDEQHLALIRELQLRSYIGVPLTRGGKTFGVITLMMADSQRTYTRSDLDLAMALADRAAIAVENARLFRAVEQARSDAVLANRAKDDFLAMLGHELRNPLAPIVTALDLMRQKPDAGAPRERAIIERQVRHVVRLVDDLLDISRIIRGRVELAKEPVEVADVVSKALELAGPMLEERRQHVELRLQPGLAITGDATRLTQVLTNLLLNAAKYTDPGGHIELSAAREAEWLVLRVKDDGSGIAPEMLSRIFELFVQAPQTIERARGGLGLGLTIVQSLVQLFGGSVTAHSSGPGQGSQFIVRLPYTHPSGAAGVNAPPQQGEGAGRALRVLVVDDNVDALEMLVEALRLDGTEAHGAPDAEAALAVAGELQPDLALLDIGLPGMDGYELGQRLRGLPGLEQLKLVALTGYGQASDRERSQAAGFDAHLVKPVSLEALSTLLKRHGRSSPPA